MKRTMSMLAVASVAASSGTGFSAETRALPGADWQETAAEAQGVDTAKLEAALAYLRENSGKDGTHEVVIIRNGVLIWKGDRVDKVHGIWSATKSFTSTVLGLLIDDGACTLETRAAQVLPSMAVAYPEVTLRHFTTMTSGYRAVGDEPHGTYEHGPSSTPFVPDATPLFAPGTKYAYWDSAMNQFGNALTRIAGEPLHDLFKRRIADPIGMRPSGWAWGDFGKVDGITVNGGSGNNGKQVQICARELARLGLLFLYRGDWNGKQLVSSEWIDQATRTHVPTDMALGHRSSADGRGVYGFNWWVNGVRADGQRKWPGAPAGTYSASGYNNNDMFIIPEWNMVVVRLGLDENERKITDAVYGELLRRIGQALGD